MIQVQEQGFSLVSGLAAELTGGKLELPSLPEAVVSIRKALAQPEFTVDELVRLIRSEPTLAGTILTMANSAAFCRSGNDTSDLKVAISRIGVGMVQSAATTFALRQIRNGAEFQEVAELLAPEWLRASRTAATAFLVARASRAATPDEALVVGLIHNIGRIYLLSRAPRYPELFESPEQVAELLASWQAGIGKAIVEYWKLPAATATAVERQDEISDDPEHPAMAVVLTAAVAITALAASGTAVAPGAAPTFEETDALAGRADFLRLGLGSEDISAIAVESEAVRQSLGLTIA